MSARGGSRSGGSSSKSKFSFKAEFKADDQEAWKQLANMNIGMSNRQRKKMAMVLSGNSTSTALTTGGWSTFSTGSGFDVAARVVDKQVSKPVDLKLNLCMIYDCSGSMSPHYTAYAKALRDIQRMVSRTPQISTCKVQGATFDRQYNKTIHGMMDIENMETSRFHKNMGRHMGDLTALWDGIYKATHDFNINGWRPRGHKKTLVLTFTDGGDNNSEHHSASDIRQFIRGNKFKHTSFHCVACGSADVSALRQVFSDKHVHMCRQTTDAIRTAIANCVQTQVEKWVQIIARKRGGRGGRSAMEEVS